MEEKQLGDCKMKKLCWVMAISLIIVLTVANLGQFITIRAVVKNHQAQLVQIQTAINQRDQNVNRMIGQLKSAKTISEVKEVLETIQ